MTNQGIRPGYKQTEVGVIPEDWEVVSLRETLVSNPSYGINAAAVPYSSNLPRYIRITDITDDGGFSQEKPVCVDSPFSSNYQVECGDILLARTGASVGKSYLHQLTGDALVYAGFLILARPNRDKTDPYYIYATLNTPRYWNWIKTESQRSGQPGINGKQYASFSFAMPPRPEQHAIAQALADSEGVIAGLEAVIAKKCDLKQAAMQRLLTGKTRLPGFGENTSRFKNSEIGEIPEDWSTASLREIVDPNRGIRYGIVQPGKHDPAGRYMIRGQDYSEVKGWADPEELFRVAPIVEERYQNARVRAGDLIMTIVGYCGYVETVPDWLNDANLTQTTARLAILPSKADASYCKAILNSQVGRLQVATFTKGAAQPGLNCGDVEKFRLPMPPVPEQTAIAEVLSDMDVDLAALGARLAKAREVKQGMMQQLLTGKVRLI